MKKRSKRSEAVRARPVKGPRMLQASGKHQYNRRRRVTGLGRRDGAAGVRAARCASGKRRGKVRERNGLGVASEVLQVWRNAW